MLIRYAMLAIACFASVKALVNIILLHNFDYFFAFISMIGIFPKLLEKVKGARYYLLIECLLAYGAALANLIYVFKISVPVTWVGYTIICLFGGIFVGCLAGALTEVLNVIPIAARRFSVRRNLPYVIYGLAAGKLVGSVLSVVLGM